MVLVGLSSCHLIISVVIAFRSACFVAPPASSLLHRPSHLVLSLLAICAPVLLICVLVWFLIASLPVSSTSWAGRSLLACLVRCGSRPLVSFSSLASLVPMLACPTVDRSRRPRFRPRRCRRLRSCLVSPRCFFSTFFDKRGRGGCRLVICLLTPVLGCGFPYRAGGWTEGCCLLASWMADGIIGGGLRTAWALAWLLACFGWRRAMWCRRRVVFGLWCRCLYI